MIRDEHLRYRSSRISRFKTEEWTAIKNQAEWELGRAVRVKNGVRLVVASVSLVSTATPARDALIHEENSTGVKDSTTCAAQDFDPSPHNFISFVPFVYRLQSFPS